MPSRIVREGILSSDRVDRLGAAAEVFYRRLMSKVDDHGLYDARPSVMAAGLYPLRVRDVSDADVAGWLAECVAADLVAVYWHAGKPYVHMLDTKWQTRSASKYPLPDVADGVRPVPSVNTRAQPLTNAHLDVVVDVVLDVAVVEDVVVVVDVDKSKALEGEGGGLLPGELPKNLSPETWKLWKAHLAAIGKGMTLPTERLQLVRLAEHDDPEKVVKDCIEKGRRVLPPIGGYESEKVNAGTDAKREGPPWWSSDATIIAKGAELNLSARPGESMSDFKGRINARISAKP